jgi:hypothetical protein
LANVVATKVDLAKASDPWNKKLIFNSFTGHHSVSVQKTHFLTIKMLFQLSYCIPFAGLDAHQFNLQLKKLEWRFPWQSTQCHCCYTWK